MSMVLTWGASETVGKDIPCLPEGKDYQQTYGLQTGVEQLVFRFRVM